MFMTIQFNVHYKTEWGQTLGLVLLSPGNEQSFAGRCVDMQCNDKMEWSVTIENTGKTPLLYRYAVKNAREILFYEYGDPRKINLSAGKEIVRVFDNWRGPYGDSPFATTVFSDIFFKRTAPVKSESYKGNLVLRLNCIQMEPGRHFAVVGNQDALGNWDVSKKVRMDESAFPVWEISLDTIRHK